MQHSLSMSASEMPLKNDIVTLAQGSGGQATYELVKDIIAPQLNMGSSPLGDAAIISFKGGKLAFTTDSFVLKPCFFPGCNIGKLSVFGTVNDLAVQGAIPQFVSLALIIEEGFPLAKLRQILESINDAAKKASVKVLTGDTKVVGKGQCDEIFINTSGIGFIETNLELGINKVTTGDSIIVSGPVGTHGVSVMSARYGFDSGEGLVSDCAPLNIITQGLVNGLGDDLKWMRDPTRGGVANTLNELAKEGCFDLEIDEEKIPCLNSVKLIAEMLGIDVMESANEGIFIAVVSPKAADEAVSIINNLSTNPRSSIIGRVSDKNPDPKVFLNTTVGGKTIISMPTGEQLPRIC